MGEKLCVCVCERERECVIVLISEYRAQLQFMIFVIFCVLSSHQ